MNCRQNVVITGHANHLATMTLIRKGIHLYLPRSSSSGGVRRLGAIMWILWAISALAGVIKDQPPCFEVYPNKMSLVLFSSILQKIE